MTGPVLWGSRLLVEAGGYAPLVLEPSAAEGIEYVPLAPVDESDEARVASDVTAPDEDAALAAVGRTGADGRFVAVRMELGRYDRATRRTIVRAFALAEWSRAARFCPTCGFALAWNDGGRGKTCTNPQRAHRLYPRLDPAIIVLVEDGEHALLGRPPSWDAGIYSTIAGFVEPGESVEDAVAREVFEETRVRIDELRYVGSEPWPFPRSLMLGFTAHAAPGQRVVVGEELEDARWFTRAEARAVLGVRYGATPFFETMSRRLIEGWLTSDDR
ncbi:MAG TPA: NAD(+) diphosphatase [Candidatus Limnocylindria bacterium]|jgi:NAD+ diphosphatase|nr:NAD(+) diphosphatase [Candidatus Limnocylindria bacterium]